MEAILRQEKEQGKEIKVMTRSMAVNYYHLHNQGQYTTFLVKERKDPTHIEVINGRSAVKKFLKGGTMKYDPAEKGLIPLYRQGGRMRDDKGHFLSPVDPSAKQGYRMIAVEGIVEIRMMNVIIKVTND